MYRYGYVTANLILTTHNDENVNVILELTFYLRYFQSYSYG